MLSDVRHDGIVEQLRGSDTRTRAVGSLQSILAELAGDGDMVLIVGWGIDNEPALLIRSDALAGAGASLRMLYPDGFLAADQPVTRALIVDFDDSDFHVDEVRLTARG